MGLDVEDRELDQEIRDMLDAWLDFDQFGILPWNRNAAADEIFPYWKNGIRYIDQMYNQARANKQQSQSQSRGRGIDSDMERQTMKQERRRSIGRR